MRFRTELSIEPQHVKIDTEDCIFSIGSCFASEMSTYFRQGQIQNLHNPFGTIFHPIAIKNAIESIVEKRIYTSEDLNFHNEKYFSFDHHSSFNRTSPEVTLENINKNIEDAHLFLKKSKWVIITVGTAWIYEYDETGKIVANCHKVPQNKFSKRLLTNFEIEDALSAIIRNLQHISGERLQILFSVSPVRHVKEGLVENQRSKSMLISALHQMVETHDHCHYLPIYEIMMDDLRDYRFYAQDMLHPTPQAVQYIWDKFSEAYISKPTLEFIRENFSINKALQHRIFDKNSAAFKNFQEQLRARIEAQQHQVKHKIFTKVADLF